MIKHNIALLVAILWCGHHLHAQSPYVQLGDQEFNQLNYVKAIAAYEASGDKNMRAWRNLAVSYTHLGRYEQVQEYLEEVCKNRKRVAEDLWNYGQVLLRCENYALAKEVFQQFYKEAPRDSRAKAYRNAGDFVFLLSQLENNYTIERLPFNNQEQDFGPSLYGSTLVFASTRHKRSPLVRTWNGNNTHFLNLFAIDSTRSKAKPVPFNRKFNQKFHEGPIAFSRLGRTCILTKTIQGQEDESGKMPLGLFFSTKIEEKWSELTPFAYNDSSYSVAHAALSGNDSILYFTSTMPGGKGGSDIWRTTLCDTGWTNPIPLDAINTPGNEAFPYMLEKGILLFASDGHVGLGGFDLFAAKARRESFVKVRNLGSPVNSSADDFGLITNPDMTSGYFSSNRSIPGDSIKQRGFSDTLSPLLNDDIYAIEFLQPFDFGKTLYGRILGEDGSPVEGVEIECSLSDTSRILTAISGQDGRYEINLPRVGDYLLIASKQEYFDSKTSIEVTSTQEDYESQLQINRDPNISIRMMITDGEIGDPLPEVEVTLKNLEDGKVKQFLTDGTGLYQQKMPDKKLLDSLNFQITLKKNDHLTKIIDFKQELNHFGVYDVHKTRTNQRRFDLSMRRKTLNDDLALQLGILPYFYETDKTQVIPIHQKLLWEIGRTMVINPGLEIKIVNHTDCRDVPQSLENRQANLKLSKIRAEAIYDYLVSQFPELAERITHEGAGDYQSKSECSCYRPNGSNCEDVDHQIDRRTQFIITAIE